MALTSSGYRLVVTLIDSGLNRSTKTYSLQSADWATALVDAAAVMAALEAVTDAEIQGYTLGEVFYESAISIPAAGVQIENMALITLLDDTNPLKKHTVRIPAPKTGVFVAATGDNSNVVDVDAAIVEAYCDLFNAAAEAYISDGENTEPSASGGVLNGRRIHRKSSRG